MTLGDFKTLMSGTADATITTGDLTVLSDENKKALCNAVLSELENTVNPDKKTYPSIKF